MMRILGLEGDLFDPKSEAYKKSLDRLRDVMIDAGFHVWKRSPRESTLRAYLTKEDKYPLLNPRFVFIGKEDDENRPTDYIVVTVLSKDRSGNYSSRLAEFENTPDEFFVPGDTFFDGLQYHGDFVVPVPVVTEPDADDKDEDLGDTTAVDAEGETTEAATSPPDAASDDDDLVDDLEWEIDYAALFESMRQIRAYLGTLPPPEQTVEP